ncbi:uncharacterized protein Tco025E_03177 [Trypanosoma conorhini]|uniref:Uncharacterized protein n=1 Tax=Trypanosoma conorhini TaxID=83891 RepID=A0A422PWW1_9TRYP|nr:uncharacterized protein Tco025E_03177 [Trypanosoma conorhini]RNF22245.1 hypothetical protein Tco025E_03177 [Trypanosoma conorhini]
MVQCAPAGAGDAAETYVAMAVPLLHMLQQRQTAQAAVVADEMRRRWGEQAGPATELLRLLRPHATARQEPPEEEEDGPASSTSAGDGGSDSDGSSSDEEEEDEDAEGDAAVESGDVMQTLRQIIERLPPRDAAGSPATARATAPAELAEETETEEEKRIFRDIAGAVEREMKRLAVIRKHR